MASNSSKGCWKRTTHSLDRYVYTPAFDKKSSLSKQGFVSERKWVDSLLSTILTKEPIRGPSARPASAAASVYGAAVVIPKHKRRIQSAVVGTRGADSKSPKVDFPAGVEEDEILTPEEPLELADLEPPSEDGDAYADDSFEADADPGHEEAQTAEIGINTEDVFHDHPEVQKLVKQAEKERPVSAPPGYGYERFTPSAQAPRGTGGSQFTASWGIDAINQERKLRMRDGEMVRDRALKEATVRQRNKRTPVWNFNTEVDETLRPAYEKFLRPRSAASAFSPKTPKTPPAARPNSGASYASRARPQSGESYASYQSTAPGTADNMPMYMSQEAPGSPGSPNSKYSKTLSGLRAPLPGSPEHAEKAAVIIRRQDRMRARCESARVKKEEEKRRDKELSNKRKKEMKMEAAKYAEHEEQRRRQMLEALGGTFAEEESETWLSELRVLTWNDSKSLANSLGFQTRGLV